ncbi:MAG: hypothetical protein ACYCVB_15880 [Bacilli bacterium]
MANKWLLAITAIGILLLLFGASGGGGNPGQTPGSSGATPVSSPAQAGNAGAAGGAGTADTLLRSAIAYETFYDHELEGMIDQISGISDALVMVTVNSTPIAQYGQNVQSSRQSTVQQGGGNSSTTTTTSTQSQTVTIQGSNGGQTPLVVQQELPKVTGVLVVAHARDVILMKSEIVNAVQDVLGIPSYEITVLPRK